MKKALLLLVMFAFMASFTLQAQEVKPDWMRWHYLSEEEMYNPVRAINFTETPPPTGEPRFVAEFEPMQGVMIRYPLGIPVSLVAQLSNNCRVYCIVASYEQSSAQNEFLNAGVNMDNLSFVNASSDSYWVRDYGPWYIFEDRHPAIVDNIYNRPRPNDDNMSGVFANFWNIPMYGMNLEHTGGNMMEDGRGHGVSDDLVINENGNNEANVRQKMLEYLGIDNYHITIDPQGEYIAHVDCWGKYLAPDKILIAQLPQSNPRYQYYEQVAQYFATTNCCWGYPYHVYRVQEPGGDILAPYTNSLILNNCVYVPMGSNNNYNQQAIQVYQNAMPGYEIIGVNYNSYWGGWQNTDALHCRTRGVMDFDMLYIDHRDVVFGEQPWQNSIPIVSKFIAYSGAELKQDSLLVYYSIDGGEYQVSHMTATGNPDEYIGFISGYNGGSTIDYYVFGADESGHRYTQPVFGPLDPHHFTMGAYQPTGELVLTPDTLWFEDDGEKHFYIINNTAENITINQVETENEELELHTQYPLPYVLAPDMPFWVEVYRVFPFSDNNNDVSLLKDYSASEVTVSTSMGEKKEIVMLQSWGDVGALISGVWSTSIELTAEEPDVDLVITNGNNESHAPILISRIYEDVYVDNITEIHVDQQLPYILNWGEELVFHVSPNYGYSPLDDVPGKTYLEAYIIVDTDGINPMVKVKVDENILTSVTEATAETKLYPNPTSGQFTVEGLNVAKVEVYSLVGQKVYEEMGQVVNINATDWNKGIYLVNIINQNGAVETKKLVVK